MSISDESMVAPPASGAESAVMADDEFHLELAILLGRFWTRLPARYRSEFKDDLEVDKVHKVGSNLVRVIVDFRVPLDADERDVLTRMLESLGCDTGIVEPFVLGPHPGRDVGPVGVMSPARFSDTGHGASSYEKYLRAAAMQCPCQGEVAA